MRGGTTLLQLRCKTAASGAFLDLAGTIAHACHDAGARLIINDRPDIAVLAAADGVHVGQDDLAVGAVRAIVGPAAIVGVSTHTREQIDEALSTAATYVAVGPIFATGTKATGYEARGLDLLRYAAGRGKPIVAIGGITLERAPSVIDAGAAAVAVITDLLEGGDVEARARAFALALPPGSLRV